MGKTRDGRGPEDLPAVGKRKSLCAGKVDIDGGGGGGARKSKAFVFGEESDNESDAYLVSLCRQKTEVHERGKVDCSVAGRISISRSLKNCWRNGDTERRILRSDTERCRQDGGNGLERGAKLGAVRNRGQEAVLEGEEGDAIHSKKIKTYSWARGRDTRAETDAKTFSLDTLKCGIGKALIRASPIRGQKQVTMEHESLNEKRMRADLEGSVSHDAQQTNCSEHSNQKMLRMPKRSSSSSNDHHFSLSCDVRGIRVQGRGGVLKVLPSSQKLSGKNGISVKKISQETRKSPRHSVGAVSADRSTLSHCSASDDVKSLTKPDLSSITKETGNSTGGSGGSGQCSWQHHSLSEGRKTLKKRGSSFAFPMSSPGQLGPTDQSMSIHHSLPKERSSLRKSASYVLLKGHNCARNVSPAEEGKCLEVKRALVNLSPKVESENADNLCNKIEDKGGMRRRYIRKDPPSKNHTTSENVSRSTEKQKLRDHIKSMLLSAGWKIDMRPRRDKNYEDAVYISPQGTGYWSITKAYGVLEEQFNKKDATGSTEGKELCGQLSKASSEYINGAAYQFSAIPSDVLAILKKKVVNKRRRRIEKDIKAPQEKGSGSKKAKYATSLKSAKIKEKVLVVKKKIHRNGILSSSRKKSKNQRGCALLARTAKQGADLECDNYIPYAGKRSVLTWLIDSGSVPVNGKVKYMNTKRTRVMLKGLITRDGIQCSCCSKILTVSKFAIHAGSKMNWPYANIFLEGSGISLLKCQLDTWKKQEEPQRRAFYSIGVTDNDPNDDTCGICGDGGNLMCCDGCPSTFHLSCLSIQMLPPGEWHCTNCLCGFCGLADGNNAEGNSTTGSLLLSCGQCGKKFHQACSLEVNAALVDSSSSSLSFCGQNCRMLFEQLQSLLGVKNDLEGGFSWILVHCLDDDSLSSFKLAQWAECNSKTAVALTVMDECFQPITDLRSGINLIKNVIYNCGSNFTRLNYGGFYTFILERGDEIISAASIRIHGTSFAEMPFIGTRHIYRRQGMCRRLLNAIEVALGSLKIGKLVIPAISELRHTWTEVFGFRPLDDSDKQEIKNNNMLVFPGTGLLHKSLLRWANGTLTEGGAMTIQSDIPVLHNGSLDHHASDNDIFSCLSDAKNEVENIETTFSAVSSSIHATHEGSCQPSNASCV